MPETEAQRENREGLEAMGYSTATAIQAIDIAEKVVKNCMGRMQEEIELLLPETLPGENEVRLPALACALGLLKAHLDEVLPPVALLLQLGGKLSEKIRLRPQD